MEEEEIVSAVQELFGRMATISSTLLEISSTLLKMSEQLGDLLSGDYNLARVVDELTDNIRGPDNCFNLGDIYEQISEINDKVKGA